MHIDEVLLGRVIEIYGYSSKTEAVEMALRELDRQAQLREYGKKGMGLSPQELADSIYPGYDPKDLANYDPLGLEVAQTTAKYGK
mgnify:CR=1 FL=1